MAEVTKEDIRELHKKIGQVHRRIDDMIDVNTSIQVSITKIDTTLNLMKIPEQPCSTLTDHINDHNENKRILKKSVVDHFLDLVKAGVVLLAGYIFGKKL